MNSRRLFFAFMLSILCGAATYAQRTVSGVITDSSSGKPLQSVSVTVKGMRLGTQTTTEGNFTITVPASATTLVISSIGYGIKQIPISSENLTISLAQLNTTLNDVVVIGYGTTTKKDVTGSIATVNQRDFQKGTITTPEQLISGKVAGVQVISNGGAPGSGSTIRIRGGASINASNNPLIIIDGIPLSGDNISGVSNPLATINPNDIASFTILKDAASTAIYGSRASNGVIIITTKKGTRGAPTINVSSNFSVNTIAKKVDVLTADQLKNYVDTSSQSSSAFKALLGSANTDWQKEIYQTALTSDNSVSISGSTKNLPYRISTGYLSQQGILKTDKIDRGTASVSLSPTLFDNHLKIDINASGTLTESHFANQGAIGAAVNYDPTQPVYDSKGNYFEYTSNGIYEALAPSNPLALLNQFHSIGYTARSFGNIQFDYKVHFLPDLHVHLNLGYDAAYGHGTVTADSSKQGNVSSVETNYSGYKSLYKQYVNNTVGEFYLNYLKDVTAIKGNINAVAGYGYYNNKTSNYSYPAYYLNGDSIPNSAPTLPLDIEENTLISYYGRLIYTQSQKYVFQGSIRTDGSSRFAKSNRWGVFPSGAFTWRINKEAFLTNSKTVSDLKLRLSYGVTGQQNLSNGTNSNNYLYLPTYYQTQTTSQYELGNRFYSLFSPSAYAADIRWEQTAAYDAGMDFGFLKNRINGSFDFYHKKTTNLLNTFNIPVGTNFSNQITDNIGNMNTDGFEFQINAGLITNKNFQWNVNYNFAYNKRKITKLTLNADSTFKGNTAGGISGATGQSIEINSVGYEPYSFYVYKQVYDQTTGKPIEGLYGDLNRDGVINDNDRYHYKSPFAPVTMGFTNEFIYKNWSLNAVFRASIGNYLYNNLESSLGVTRSILNPNNFLENAPVSTFATNFVTNQYQSDYYIQNASFLKLDNIGITYNIGSVFSPKSNLIVGVNCQNVFVITKYKGNDPEVYYNGSGNIGIDNGIYPRPRIYTASVNLKF